MVKAPGRLEPCRVSVFPGLLSHHCVGCDVCQGVEERIVGAVDGCFEVVLGGSSQVAGGACGECAGECEQRFRLQFGSPQGFLEPLPLASGYEGVDGDALVAHFH